MKEVFEIFEGMQVMSENINSFFAHGLQDTTGAGKTGVEAGEDATSKTRSIGDI